MKKSELINFVASNADISTTAAAKALEAVMEGITKALQDGEQVVLAGFGTFSVRQRAAREGRNPRTGKTIEIAATTVPNFKASKGLKDAIVNIG